LPSSHATNSYAVLPTALAFVHATSEKYRVRKQTLRTLQCIVRFRNGPSRSL